MLGYFVISQIINRECVVTVKIQNFVFFQVVDAELQAGALKRRLALLEEETARVKVFHLNIIKITFFYKFIMFKIFCYFIVNNMKFFQERLQENVEKCKTIETSGQENEDARKAGEARLVFFADFQNENISKKSI